MPLTLKKTVAVLDGHVAIEEAENLLNWLIDHPKGRINLKNLEHAHTAVWQVLIASRPKIAAYPEQRRVGCTRCLVTDNGTDDEKNSAG